MSRTAAFFAYHQALLAAHQPNSRARNPTGIRYDVCVQQGGHIYAGTLGRSCCQFPNSNEAACNYPVPTGLPSPIALSWIAASLVSAKPLNATTEWVEITHAPGPGPAINGKPTQQGRGVVHRDDGSSDYVVVFGIKQDHPAGWLAAVQIYEDVRMPECTPPSQAVYAQAASGDWPSDHPQQYLCGIPLGQKGDLDLFQLPSTAAPSPTAPASSTYSGILVKEPAGVWLPASFFATKPPGYEHLWVQIKTPPGYQGTRFGYGILHRDNKRKNVLIIEIKGGQHPQVRFVPNDAPFFAAEPQPPGPAPTPTGPVGGQGFAPFSTSSPGLPRRSRRRGPR
jgi:hypothetical protein